MLQIADPFDIAIGVGFLVCPGECLGGEIRYDRFKLAGSRDGISENQQEQGWA